MQQIEPAAVDDLEIIKPWPWPCDYIGICPCYKKWNPVTCSCECIANKSCPKPLDFSKNICDCVCKPPARCPCGSKWNPKMCRCVKTPVNTCVLPLVFNAKACDCICEEPKECPCHYTWNPTKCACVCKQYKQCKLPSVWSNKPCDCICPQTYQLCPKPKIWSDATCSCQCPSPPIQCPDKQYYNKDTCSCTCKIFLEVPREELVKKCPYNSPWNDEKCDCVECNKNDQEKCKILNWTWDGYTCGIQKHAIVYAQIEMLVLRNVVRITCCSVMSLVSAMNVQNKNVYSRDKFGIQNFAPVHVLMSNPSKSITRNAKVRA